MLSENVQIAIITSLAVAIPALLAQYLMHLRQSRKLEEIHTQTNSNLEEQKKEVKEARVEVKEIRTEVKDLNKHIQVLTEEKGRAEARVEEKGKADAKAEGIVEGEIKGTIEGIIEPKDTTKDK